MTQDEKDMKTEIQRETVQTPQQSLGEQKPLPSTSSYEVTHNKLPIEDCKEIKTVAIEKPYDKKVYCLNHMPRNVKKLQISGINVFLGNDGHSYSFPSNRKTIKFVV